MITQDIKSNINKIDYNLKNLFENVYIKEKSLGNQFYFEINVNSTFFNLNESSSWKRAEVKIKINKTNLISDIIKWSYSVHPLNESADWIERVSKLDNIAKDIYEVVTKSKMEKTYLDSLDSIVYPINESVVEITKDDLIIKLKEIAERFNLEVKQTTKDKIVNDNIGSYPDLNIKIYTDSHIKVSDRFMIESEILKIEGVNWVLFKEGFIEVNLSK